MAKKKTDPTHLAAGYNAGKKEVRLREKRARISQRTKGVNKVTGKRKKTQSAINTLRGTRVKRIGRKIKEQDSVPGRDVPLPRSKFKRSTFKF